MTDPNNIEPRFSESELRRLIERAAQLENRRWETVSLSELREIARDVGISDVALKAALAERHESRHAMAPARWRIVGHPISLVAIGAIGSMAMMTLPSVNFYGFISLAAINLLCAVDANRPKAFSSYLKRSVGMWIGFTGVAALRFGLPDILSMGLLAAISMTGLGMVAIVRGLTAEIGDNDNQGPDSLRSRFRHIVRRVKAWLHQVTEMSGVTTALPLRALPGLVSVARRQHGPDFS